MALADMMQLELFDWVDVGTVVIELPEEARVSSDDNECDNEE